MNRYKYSRSSQATADTLCQKCLKKGHYSYECTASAQDRPYVSRPSRMQQFLNPKLAPKITAAVPKAEEPNQTDKAGSKNSKRKSTEDGSEAPPRKRPRSVSSYSSNSVSSISTNRSRFTSHSPPGGHKSGLRSKAPRSPNADKVSADRAGKRESKHATNRTSTNSSAGESSDESRTDNKRRRSQQPSKKPTERRERPRDYPGTRSRSPIASPPSENPRSQSRSPYRRRDRERSRKNVKDDGFRDVPSNGHRHRPRSLSPYSKRVALTQGGGSGEG